MNENSESRINARNRNVNDWSKKNSLLASAEKVDHERVERNDDKIRSGATIPEILIAIVVIIMATTLGLRFVATGVRQPFALSSAQEWSNYYENTARYFLDLSSDHALFRDTRHPEPFAGAVTAPAGFISSVLVWENTEITNYKVAVFTVQSLNGTMGWRIYREVLP